MGDTLPSAYLIVRPTTIKLGMVTPSRRAKGFLGSTTQGAGFKRAKFFCFSISLMHAQSYSFTCGHQVWHDNRSIGASLPYRGRGIAETVEPLSSYDLSRLLFYNITIHDCCYLRQGGYV